jgi:hypothetical protein
MAIRGFILYPAELGDMVAAQIKDLPDISHLQAEILQWAQEQGCAADAEILPWRSPQARTKTVGFLIDCPPALAMKIQPQFSLAGMRSRDGN